MHTTERSKASNGGERDMHSIDRLSDLPDSILCHILSFLPTKTSISTSILARRWRFVWKYVPTLDFYLQNQDIINRVLVLHQVPIINTLRLFVNDNRCSEYQTETWIIAAVARNVRNIEISYLLDKKLQLPLQLFTCQTLVDLSLDCCCIIPFANTVWLPRLKKLKLSYIQFETDESLPRLLWGCPVLEHLQVTLDVTLGRDLSFCHISSPTLKRLEVGLACLDFDGFPGYRLKIDTPVIVYLEIYDSLSEHIESGMMTSLTEANIHLNNDEAKEDDFVYSQSVLQFVNSLCNVKCLELEIGYSTKIIDSVATVRFHNLMDLNLTAHGLLLFRFLENADNLEFLMFTEVCVEGQRAWVEPEQVPTCLSSHLRTVEMCYVDTSSDFEIVRYLLRNARILEHIEISHNGYFEGKKWSIEEVSQIERGSEACEIAVV